MWERMALLLHHQVACLTGRHLKWSISVCNRLFNKQILKGVGTRGFIRQLSNPSPLRIEGLSSIVGAANVSSSPSVLEQHCQDESPYKGIPPDAVVFPSTLEEVCSLVKYCSNNNIPIIPYGTGTGLESGISAVKGGVCIDLSRNMKGIVSFHPYDFDITLEPGVTRKMVNHHLKDHGLWFPIDPGADASLCGMAATSASGTNAVRYGTMRENVLNLEVVLPNGEVLHTQGKGRRPKKSSAGYNLTNLFVGSEGTLGIITKVTIRLSAVPEVTASAVCSFPNVQAAVNTTVQTLQCSVPIARIEFLDDVSVSACNNYSHTTYDLLPTLFLEFHGSQAEINAQVLTVGDIVATNGGSELKWSTEQEERNKLWTARHNLLYATLAMKPGYSKALYTDVCVPISNLSEMIMKSREIVQGENILAPMFGHVGDGNFHCNLLFDPTKPEQLIRMKAISKKFVKLALLLDGTCTGEHGVGIGKKGYLEEELGSIGLKSLKAIKAAFDPKGIMNPGKVLDM